MNSPESLPPALREQLDRERPDERDELERVWHLLGETAPPDVESPDSDAAWEALQQQLDASDASSARERTAPDRSAVHRSRRRSVWRRWAGAAALLLAAAVAGVLFWQRPVRLSTAPGEHRSVTLPDGSTAELNSGTTLSYQRGFGILPLLSSERRTVTLQGEAFFDVREGERSFVVNTFSARVRVLGTRFNVRARPKTSTPETRVTLADGRVRVAAQDSARETVTLTEEGQSSRVAETTQSPTAPQATSMARVLAWRQQGFAVSNQPLTTIFDRLERLYGVRLALRAAPATTDSMTLFYPQRTDVKTILHDICVAQDLKFRSTSRGYEIYREKGANY